MTYELPPYFILKRYRPSISETYPELSKFKDISVLISTTKRFSTWHLEIIEHPEVILSESELVQSSDDRWLNHTSQNFNVYSDNKNNVSIKYNNCFLRHNSGCIPVFKMSEPCYTLPIIFLNLNTEYYKSFRFELIVRIVTNIRIQALIDKNESCPVSMIPLTRCNTILTSCNHAFSKNVEKWISEKGSCPVCRSSQKMDTLTRWI